jgi:hypothetical protein
VHSEPLNLRRLALDRSRIQQDALQIQSLSADGFFRFVPIFIENKPGLPHHNPLSAFQKVGVFRNFPRPLPSQKWPDRRHQIHQIRLGSTLGDLVLEVILHI